MAMLFVNAMVCPTPFFCLKSSNSLSPQSFPPKLQVQPDLEELTTNMELPDDQLQKPQEKLGRLQYRIDYDFGQNNVSCSKLQPFPF